MIYKPFVDEMLNLFKFHGISTLLLDLMPNPMYTDILNHMICKYF